MCQHKGVTKNNMRTSERVPIRSAKPFPDIQDVQSVSGNNTRPRTEVVIILKACYKIRCFRLSRAKLKNEVEAAEGQWSHVCRDGLNDIDCTADVDTVGSRLQIRETKDCRRTRVSGHVLPRVAM